MNQSYGDVDLKKSQAVVIGGELRNHSGRLIGQLMQTLEILSLSDKQENALKDTVKDIARRFIDEFAGENGALQAMIDPKEGKCKYCGDSLMLACNECPSK